MRFGQDLRKTTPSTPSESANEAVQKWVNNVMDAFEERDPNIVERLFEDSDNIKVSIESVPPAEGREAVKAVYEWMFKADDHVKEWELRVATAVGNQVMYTIEDAEAESKGKTKKQTRVHLVAEKSTIPGQEGKIRTLTLYGDNSKNWVEGYERRSSGKRPDFNARSRRH